MTCSFTIISAFCQMLAFAVSFIDEVTRFLKRTRERALKSTQEIDVLNPVVLNVGSMDGKALLPPAQLQFRRPKSDAAVTVACWEFANTWRST
ncbi:hypothetical protein P175DRAFT_0559232 [Aspergillus ochraceoroseus IBT 24754]|uniref:Uncharacterized protein n=1 Tax=Aspergillus ochraceoroseus IBT 24754 TaxID=1392256 RepID=A0A2T5LTR3_9EURO|nr:uncharacterized protein P175DRAFT_0559232 [Aspergillus ochraceoroseus IBT 24754]PTU19672.1 hypothetical protein P175DRAFT_0559232 [Aspergillus ochraceoroseus IBT 24754]